MQFGRYALSIPCACPHTKKETCKSRSLFYGAGDEARTRYLHLGKVALYRMSYARICLELNFNFKQCCLIGASGRNRTNDTRIFSPLLYLLSYRGVLRKFAQMRKGKNGDPERTRTVDLQRDRLAC